MDSITAGPSTRGLEADSDPQGSLSKDKGKRRPSQDTDSEFQCVDKDDEGKTAWDEKNILSLDGGGVRGLYTLYILQQLMNNIKLIELSFAESLRDDRKISSFSPSDEPLNVSHIAHKKSDFQFRRKKSTPPPNGHFLPCHYFDSICGTSTGGLIAIMLSRFRMTVEDCIQEYETLAGDVFGHSRWLHQMSPATFWLPLHRTKYNTEDLEDAIKAVINRREKQSNDGDIVQLETKNGTCRTFVIADKNEGTDGAVLQGPYIFRSYNHSVRGTDHGKIYPRNPGEACTYPVWRVARATTAAPLFFDPLIVSSTASSNIAPSASQSNLRERAYTFTLGGRKKKELKANQTNVTFTDGGLGRTNNPAEEAFHEVKTSNERIGTLVSIGTGRPTPNHSNQRLKLLVQNVISRSGNPMEVHEAVKREAETARFEYFRLDQPNGVPDVEFDDWEPPKSGERTKDKIHRAFSRWAIDIEVTSLLQECAIELVHRRRKRTKDLSRWELYALGASFDCRESNCTEPASKRWDTRNEFEAHLREAHPTAVDSETSLDNAIRRGRQEWTYRPPPPKDS